MLNKNQKKVICIMASILLICAGGLLYYFHCTVQQVKAFVEKTNEEENVAQFTDSLYSNFTSTDLKMVDLKGYVHTLEFKEIAKFDGYDRSILNLSLIFDKKGNIVDIQASYKQSNDNLYTAEFERNKDGQIESISVRTSYTTCGGDSYKGFQIYHLRYDDMGHVSGISIEDQSEGGRGGEMSDVEIAFSDYNKGKGYQKRIMDYDDGIASNHESILLSDIKCDTNGNWISRSGKLTQKRMIYSDGFLDDEEENSERIEYAVMKEERTITYYKKEEIDFSSYVK